MKTSTPPFLKDEMNPKKVLRVLCHIGIHRYKGRAFRPQELPGGLKLAGLL